MGSEPSDVVLTSGGFFPPISEIREPPMVATSQKRQETDAASSVRFSAKPTTPGAMRNFFFVILMIL